MQLKGEKGFIELTPKIWNKGLQLFILLKKKTKRWWRWKT